VTVTEIPTLPNVNVERRLRGIEPRPSGPFGGGWRFVLGVKVGRRCVVFELIAVSIRVQW